MSAPLKTNTPAPSTGKHDWVHVMMHDELEVYDTKVGKHKQCWQVKKEVKEKEVREHQQREEAECWVREEAACLKREAATIQRQEEHQEREADMCWEAAIKKAMEMVEKRAQEDMEEKQAEVVRKIQAAEEMARQQEEAEASNKKLVMMKRQARKENMVAGPSGMPGPGPRCVQCTRMGAECKWDLENKHQHACMQCVRDKEKCEWLEVVESASGSRSRDVKGKGKVVVTSPRAGEKRKHIKKSAVKVINSNIKIIARPSDVSRSGSGHALLQHMDHLILAVENLTECQDHVQLQSLIQSKDQPGLDTEAQWYMASACAASRMAVGTLMDECNFLGFKRVGPGEEEEEEETDMEAVNQEVVEQEVAKLQKEVLEPWPLDNEM
ncbi:hypothetical protein SCLCIDRAFT_25577 [Scleroderma citrinum Foug A]|uniref:Zn(2)-C6 fungal-type domain-containing protein n=1 Tax=Scleroderma citrinum Foug A TaxID=1036808 RepID=A0A0C3DM81_9AGAM|nr:hypothetical protein SCLCIDRAFT_25577 [Scleroderma citrinum Foug A]